MATKKKTTTPKFMPKVGQRVRFRSWESMEAEFGLTPNGYIDCHWVFTDMMRHLCGTTATVASVGSAKESPMIRLDKFSATGDTIWSYSTDMLEPAKMTKAEKEAEAKRIAEHENAEAAKKFAEEKAKAKKEAKRAALPSQAQSFLRYLDANTDAFGCQRKHVVATVGAILGVDLTPLT